MACALQTNSDFLWIIQTDPALAPAIRDAMIDLISPFPNFFFVGNNGFPGNFRMNPLSAGAVLSGDLGFATRIHHAAREKVLVETRLDADDGLHNEFIATVKEEAELLLLSARKTSGSNSTDANDGPGVVNTSLDGTESPLWMVWCAYTILEWHTGHSPDSTSGYLVGVATDYCVTAGLTVGYSAATPFVSVPNGSHNKLHLAVPPCSRSRRSNCLHRMAELQPTAIRSRTTTSAGMHGVVVKGASKKDTTRSCST